MQKQGQRAPSEKDRYKAIARFQRTGDLWVSDGFWAETISSWKQQGAPDRIGDPRYRGECFGYSRTRWLGEITSWLVILPYSIGGISTFLSLPPILPRFEPRLIEEEANTVIVFNPAGQTVRILKDDPRTMPMYLDQPVKDWATWNEYKKRLDPDTPERWPSDWNSYVEKINAGNYPVILGVGSFFGFLREWMGLEALLYAFHDDPGLVDDMMETVLHLEMEVIRRTVKDIQVDQAAFWEDMCFKSGPLISPAMFRKHMMPHYRQRSDPNRWFGEERARMATQPHLLVKKSIPLTDRVQSGYEDIEAIRFSKQPLWKERLTVLTDETVQLPLIKRKALAIDKQLSAMPVKIKDYELIVGHLFQCSLGTGVPFPEYCTTEERRAAEEKFTHPGAIFGHHCPSYERFLEHGIGGLRRMAEGKLAVVRGKDGNADTETWYQSVVMSLDALGRFILRYHDLALELSQGGADPDRKEELLHIAEITKHLSMESPRTFREAIQALWFAHAAFQATNNLLSLGRIDQYLWPFLERDLEDGAVTLEQAQELIDLLWLKFNERLQSFELAKGATYYIPDADELAKMSPEQLSKIGFPSNPWAGYAGHKGQFLGGRTTFELIEYEGELFNEWLHTTTVGGQTPDGRDATNPVTYLCLNAALRLGFPDPELYVRLHDHSPPELVQRAADVIRTGSAAPSIYNDEVIIPGLEKLGLTLEHARDYTSDGCWEVYSQGRTNFRYGTISLVESLDRALFPERWEEELQPQFSFPYVEAYDPFAGAKPPDAHGMGAFEELMASFKDRLDRHIRGFIECVDNFRDERLYEIAPLPLISALMEGPLESGKDLTLDGVTHNFHAPVFAGLSHAADSLAAIKKLCFEEETISLAEMLDAVKDNWRDNEPLRQLVMTRTPAYGNDDDFTDDIAREIVAYCVERVRHYAGRVKHSHLKFPVALGTFQAYVPIGAVTGATPDGRLGNQPISSNASPSVGRATSGQTAALNSYCKLPLIDVPNGAPLDIAMDNRASLLNQLEAYIASFVEKRGELLTISVNDCEKLKAAQKEPEKYKDLKIRIGGFQGYFTDLAPEMQNFQIKKCEQYAGS